MAQTSLPPGFRFHPTDLELCSYYLKRKIMGKKLLVEAISEVELYKYAFWDLPGICSVKLFVFSSVEIDNAICWLTLANACFSLMLNETITP